MLQYLIFIHLILDSILLRYGDQMIDTEKFGIKVRFFGNFFLILDNTHARSGTGLHTNVKLFGRRMNHVPPLRIDHATNHLRFVRTYLQADVHSTDPFLSDTCERKSQ